jgi:hypothetical protein
VSGRVGSFELRIVGSASRVCFYPPSFPVWWFLQAIGLRGLRVVSSESAGVVEFGQAVFWRQVGI